MRALPRLCVTIVALCFLACPAMAQGISEERILSFTSDMTVLRNGDLSVTETIVVQAMGDRIRHGIFRDIPTEYVKKDGSKLRVRLDVVEVKRDGHTEPYEESTISNENVSRGVRIKIGDKDTLLEVGQHSFIISYITTRMIGFFPDYDELYWNVTGNGWDFGIDKVEAKIRLPEGADIIQNAFYTGPAGAQQKDAIARIGTLRARFTTTAPLGPHEGLTVSVGFKKGVIPPPSEAEKRADYILEHAPDIVSGMGVMMLLVYYLIAWWHFGRDPRRGTPYPLFAPPDKLSPSTMRFIREMAYDRACFSAALIDMAVKGYMKITEDDGDYTLTRTSKSESVADLSSGERKIARELFGGRDRIELKQANHSTINRAIEALKTGLKNDDQKLYFVTNSSWFIGGIAILGLVSVAASLLSDQPEVSTFMLVWLSGWTVGTAFLLHQAFSTWRGVFTGGPGSRIMAFFSSLFITAFALPFVGGLVFGLYIFGMALPLLTIIMLMSGAVLTYVFYYLLKAPTLAGAAVLDRIEGFRMYLATAEQHRLEMLNPPKVTPEVFEKFLPYAIALDCANQWSRKFEAEMVAAAMTPASYSPAWYSGGSHGDFNPSRFGSSIGSSLGNAAASSATAPGSSSGSSGGGSSGGGGGGGGGGGW